LKNYKKVLLQPGESKEVSFTITLDDLKFYISDLKYDWEPSEFVVQIGTNSQDVEQATSNWMK